MDVLRVNKTFLIRSQKPSEKICNLDYLEKKKKKSVQPVDTKIQNKQSLTMKTCGKHICNILQRVNIPKI